MTQPGTRAATHPTLDEVATLSGVSRATVSRVLNGSPSVSRRARTRVERAIAQLGYVPNRAARSLRTRRTELIALVVSEPAARVTSDPVLGGMIRGAANELAETDFQPVLLMVNTPAQLERVERYLLGGHVDGALLVSMHGDDSLPQKLVQSGMPVVLSGRPMRPGEGPVPISYVGADNRGGARIAVDHLVRLGRKRIATVTGPLDMVAGVDRLDGYRDELGPTYGEAEGLIEEGDFTDEGGERAMRALLARTGGIDAVFVANDLMAVGALRVLKAAGRAVPDDVAVVGFDDSPTARHCDPQLTTVRQPIEEQGRQMVQLLLAKLGGDTPAMSVLLPTELVVRQSA